MTPDHLPLTSENQLQPQMELARGEGRVRLQEILGLLVVAGVGNSVGVGGVLREGGGFGGQAIGCDLDTLVVAVEEVEGVCGEFQAIALADVDLADEAQISGGVIGSGEGVAGVAWESVVEIVTVLVGIAVDGGVDGASAAGSDDARNFPVVEDVTQEFVFAVKGTRLDGDGSDETVALVGDAG